ncbi:hypothetical protein B0H13DRAFT_1854655 [Mycena leptocephala]|nr:hypothetical protein B0H13DRAFT_1854655 [Mycena leptocephala]
MLDNSQQAVIRQNDLIAYHGRHESNSNSPDKWWDRVAIHNASQTVRSLGVQWNRKCKICGIKVRSPFSTLHAYAYLPMEMKWDYFISYRKTASLPRKLSNLFSLTALGVYDGDFMKFPDVVAAVTLAGGRTYHRLLPAHEGHHAIRWFIHDPWAMFAKGDELKIPSSWIHSALAGLEKVNPFINKLEKLNV